jgi:hypothetical protein
MEMSKSQKHPIKLWLLASFMLSCSASVVLGGTPKDCDDTYTVAIRLMRAFYPELSGKGTNIDVEAHYPFDADGPVLAFYIQVSASDQSDRIVASHFPNPSSADRVGQLAAHFQFDGRDGRIFSIFANGSFLNDEKQQALTKLVDEHPEWSEAQMADALLQADAKFGPDQKEALMAKFPFKELERILGKIEMGPAQFTFRANAEPPSYASMHWSVRFRATKDGRIDEYTTSLEPFGGKVVNFGRRPLN